MQEQFSLSSSSSSSSSSLSSSPTSFCTFAQSIVKRGSTGGKSSVPWSEGRREGQEARQTERPSSSAESLGSGSGSSPSSIDDREEQAAGGFPSRESALMREGLTGKVQKEAGGVFMPSNFARA